MLVLCPRCLAVISADGNGKGNMGREGGELLRNHAQLCQWQRHSFCFHRKQAFIIVSTGIAPRLYSLSLLTIADNKAGIKQEIGIKSTDDSLAPSVDYNRHPVQFKHSGRLKTITVLFLGNGR